MEGFFNEGDSRNDVWREIAQYGQKGGDFAVPLEKNKKTTLHHKEEDWNENTISPRQGVPQSLLLSGNVALSKGAAGSLTVEAALVFPLFLFAMLAVLFFFRVLQVSQMTEGALAAAGSFVSLEAETEDEPLLLAVGYFQKELLKKDFPDDVLPGGRLGISWSESDLSGEYVDLRIYYQCKLPFRMFGLGNIPVSQRVYMKKWTGYPGDGDDEETKRFVYITPAGEVYHVTRECSHLKLSTKLMECGAAKSAGYTSCMICGHIPGTYTHYYVTEDGMRYHTIMDCRGLKRTIYTIPFSQVGDRRACSRCGGGE